MTWWLISAIISWTQSDYFFWPMKKGCIGWDTIHVKSVFQLFEMPQMSTWGTQQKWMWSAPSSKIMPLNFSFMMIFHINNQYIRILQRNYRYDWDGTSASLILGLLNYIWMSNALVWSTPLTECGYNLLWPTLRQKWDVVLRCLLFLGAITTPLLLTCHHSWCQRRQDQAHEGRYK